MAVDTKAPGQAPPDLPSLLLDGRICYIGMSVRSRGRALGQQQRRSAAAFFGCAWCSHGFAAAAGAAQTAVACPGALLANHRCFTSAPAAASAAVAASAPPACPECLGFIIRNQPSSLAVGACLRPLPAAAFPCSWRSWCPR